MKTSDDMLGRRLQQARRALGLTQTDVGQKMNMATSTVSELEAGKRRVSGTELYKFARIYRRPLAFFLGGEDVEEPYAFQYLFREADEKNLDAASVVDLEQLAADYLLLEELVGVPALPMPPDYSAFQFRTVEHAETLAEMERSRLKLGEAPIRDLARLIDEEVGIRVFLLPVPHESWSGLLAQDRTGRPCMAINAREEPYRRNFDMAHEYAHSLVHRVADTGTIARLDVRAEGRERVSSQEQFADAFAAAFLMPRSAVVEMFERLMRERTGSFTDDDLVHMAMYFGVSGQAMSRRLVSLRRLSRGVMADYWKRAGTFRKSAMMLGYRVDDEDTMWQAAVVPRRYRYLALMAYNSEIISISKLAEFLRQSAIDLRDTLTAAEKAERDER